MGRLVVMQRHKGLASNYDCQYCICPPNYDSLSVSPSSYGLLPVQTHPYTSRATYKDCNGSSTYYDRTSNSTWSSNHTPVATVNDSAPKGLVTAVAGGSASIGATYVGIVYMPNCQPPPCHIPCICYYPAKNGGGTADVVEVSISGPANVALRGSGSTGPNTINLTATGTPSGGSYSWSTTSGKVSLSNTTSATVTATSASASTAVGDVPVKVTYTYDDTPADKTQNITVQKPTKLAKAGTDSTTSEASCTTSGGLPGCGVTRTFRYQVLDQIGAGSPIEVGAMPYWDYICTGSPNQLNLQGYQTSCSGTTGSCAGSGPCVNRNTYSDGTFDETLLVCAPACKSGSTCITAGSTAATQTWNINGFSLTGDAKSLSYQCDRILVNGN